MKSSCIFITSLFPNNKEPFKAVFNHKIAEALSRKIRLKIIAPVPWFPNIPLFKKILPSYSNYYGVSSKEEVGDITIYHPRIFVTPKVLRFFHGFFYFLGLSYYFWKSKEKLIGKFVYCLYAYPDGLASMIFAKIHKLPIFIHVQGCDINLLTKYTIHRKLIVWSLKNCDGIISVSKDMKKKLISLGVSKVKINVITNGVDKRVFYQDDKIKCTNLLKIPQQSTKILFIGNLEPVKGVDSLLYAFKEFLTDCPKAQLFLIGDGSEKAIYRKFVKNLRIQKNIQFIGNLNQKDLQLWYNACDIFCLPSIREGYPNVLLEAKACGARVVATDVGGIPEIIKESEGDILVKPDNVDAITEAFKILSQVSSGSFNTQEVKSWEAMGNELYDYFQFKLDS